jgi:hypothetical protein
MTVVAMPAPPIQGALPLPPRRPPELLRQLLGIYAHVLTWGRVEDHLVDFR